LWKKETGLEWLSREEEELVVKVPTDTGKDICMPSATVDICLNTLKGRYGGGGGRRRVDSPLTLLHPAKSNWCWFCIGIEYITDSETTIYMVAVHHK
jgi:hypothetical protein